MLYYYVDYQLTVLAEQPVREAELAGAAVGVAAAVGGEELLHPVRLAQVPAS